MAHETITKLQAAKRQLRVAIRLFFERRDLVAVHTLAAASQEILRNLGRPRGLKSMFKDNPLVRPEKKEEVERLFTEAQNFFKHAGRDPKATLKFYHETTKFYLLDAADLYVQLTGRSFSEITVLQIWFSVKYPDLLLGRRFEHQLAAAARKIDPENYDLFLDLIGK